MKALGNFRGTIVDAGVACTSGGFPQLVAKLQVDEMWDEDAKEWAAWDDFGWTEAELKDRTIVSYNILFGKKGCTLSGDQVKKITGWEGDSFSTLAAMDLTGVKIQWRNEEDTYDGKTKVQVSWIDLYDAEPGGTVRKLDDKGIKDLDAKFNEFLTNAVKPVSAPAGGGGGKRKPRSTKAAEAPAEEPKEEVKTEAPKTETTKPKGRAGRPTKAAKAKAEAEAAAKTEAPASDPPEAPPEAPASEPPAEPEKELLETSGPCTKQEAWADVNELKSANVTIGELGDEWLAQIEKIAPGNEQKDLTEEEWGTVRAAVLDATATF
jgi:hypothetical protein